MSTTTTEQPSVDILPGEVLVATRYPTTVHYRHPERVDATRCGCRVRYSVRPDQVGRGMLRSICYTCDQRARAAGEMLER